MKTLLGLILLTLTCVADAQPTGYNTGRPFGAVGAKDAERLEAFAKKEGAALVADMQRAYDKDEAALARVFAFSLKFTKFDKNAKAYGQMIYSSFLNLSEAYGIDRYAKIVAAQPEPVRQRIRDFIYFDATQAPKSKRAEAETAARKSAPLLFPADYVFGAGNPLFKKG